MAESTTATTDNQGLAPQPSPESVQPLTSEPKAAASSAATAVAVADDENDLSAPAPTWHSVAPSDVARYQLPSELANELTWQDEYFDDDEFCDEKDDDNDNDRIIAVFDLDYESMEEHWTKVGWTTYGTSVVLFPQLLWIDLFGLIPCYLRQNVRWNVRSRHVAVTRSGIRFVREKFRTCLGHPWTDADKFEKTIPFEAIDDCRMVEPSGRTLLWIDNTLPTVFVDTHETKGGLVDAERGKTTTTELTISGLKKPEAFRALVLAMKEHHRCK